MALQGCCRLNDGSGFLHGCCRCCCWIALLATLPRGLSGAREDVLQCPEGYYRASTILFSCGRKGLSNEGIGYLYMGPEVTIGALRVPQGMKNWHITVQSNSSQGQLSVSPPPTSWRQRETIHDRRGSQTPYEETLSCAGEAPENLVVKITNVGGFPATFSLRSTFEEIDSPSCPSSAVLGCLPYNAPATVAMMMEWSIWLRARFNCSKAAWGSLQATALHADPKGWTWSSWATVWNLWPGLGQASSSHGQVARQLQEKEALPQRLEVIGWMSSFHFLDGLEKRDDLISFQEFDKAYNLSKAYPEVSAFAESLAAFDSLDDAWGSLAGISQQLLHSLRDVPASRWEVPWSSIHLPHGMTVRTAQEALSYMGVHSSETGTVTKAQLQPVYAWGLAMKTEVTHGSAQGSGTASQAAGMSAGRFRGSFGKHAEQRKHAEQSKHAEQTKRGEQRSTTTTTQASTTTTPEVLASRTAPVPGTGAIFGRKDLDWRSDLDQRIAFLKEFFRKLPDQRTKIFGEGPEGAGLLAVVISSALLLCMLCCLLCSACCCVRRDARQQSREVSERLARYEKLGREKADARVVDDRLPPPKDVEEDPDGATSMCCCPSTTKGVDDPVRQTKFSGKGVSEFRVASPSAMLTDRLPGARSAATGAKDTAVAGEENSSLEESSSSGAGIGALARSDGGAVDAVTGGHPGRLLQLQSPGASLTGREPPGATERVPETIVESAVEVERDNPVEHSGLLTADDDSGACFGDDRVVTEAALPGGVDDAAPGKKKCRCCRAPCVCGRAARDPK